MEHGQCLTEETLTDYLEGRLDPAVKAASEVHLLACDECRRNLVFFMRLLEEDMSPEESVAINAVTVQWDKRKPSENVAHGAGGLRSWFSTAAMVLAALFVGVISFSYLWNRTAEPKTAGQVVQLLLSQHRPFELRLSDEPHLPIVRTRGTDDQGPSFSVLAGEMASLSADSHQMGRFYLIEKDFKPAIAYLEMAERKAGARADVHNDLGIAYLESGGESRFQKATQEFQHALEANARFAPAVFNLALLYERTGMSMQAESQWNRYLELDSDSSWAMEARTRLQGLSR